MIDKNFFTNNRKAISHALQGGMIVMPAYASLQRSNDSAFAFTQESNFWYLTGISEPGWLVVIDGSRGHTWLIAPDVSETHRIFDGGLTNDQAISISGVEEVINQSELPALLKQLARTHKVVYTVGAPQYAEHFNFELNPASERTRQMLTRHFSTVQDCRKDLAILRAIKQPEELIAIKKAVSVSVSAFELVHKNMNGYNFEYEIEADFGRDVRYRGATGCAYDSIVAVGGNACTLHYSKNNDRISKQKLVLMDMGAQYSGYAADISRTYVKGEPTKRQVQIHSAVESAHKRIISKLAPLLGVEEYQSAVNEIMLDAIESLGFSRSEESLRKYFPHAISHGLGIDVHDSLGAPKYFLENMVLTVEPGIYIPEENIGVRIEDDILITKNGRKNLSGSLSTGL